LKKRLSKAVLWTGAAVALAFLAVPRLRSTLLPPPAAAGRARTAAPPVLVGRVQRKVAPVVLETIGAAEPIRTAAVRSQITGTLMKVHFQEGQTVRLDDLLFEIDARPLQNTLAAAGADLQKIRVQLENARQQLARYQALNLNASVSKEQYQTVESAERVLAAELAASESAVANARLQVEYCAIRAPLPGRTGELGAHEGDLVRAGDAAVSLVTIHQLNPINVTFSVPQQYLPALERSRARGPVAVVALLPGNDDTPEPGELSFIDNAVDASTGTLRLKATFPNAAQRLWPGQFATVRVTLAEPEALVVPSAAVQNDQKGQHVFVIKANRIAEYRPVTVDRTSDSYSVITQGLIEGEAIVVDGQLRVIPGREVEIKQPAAGPAGNPGAKQTK
jgi:multidrug efflux system membrane fusion protein